MAKTRTYLKNKFVFYCPIFKCKKRENTFICFIASLMTPLFRIINNLL